MWRAPPPTAPHAWQGEVVACTRATVGAASGAGEASVGCGVHVCVALRRVRRGLTATIAVGAGRACVAGTTAGHTARQVTWRRQVGVRQRWCCVGCRGWPRGGVVHAVADDIAGHSNLRHACDNGWWAGVCGGRHCATASARGHASLTRVCGTAGTPCARGGGRGGRCAASLLRRGAPVVQTRARAGAHRTRSSDGVAHACGTLPGT